MPCATIHMYTAGKVLARWSDAPRDAPFDLHRPDLVEGFLLGAMGPDMGFVPGVDRFVSELSHYVSTGDLLRALLDEAEGPAEEAYAWGWATHHRTDVEIHPLIGRACGEVILGDRRVRMNSSDDLPAHVALEVGLDLTFLVTEPGIPEPPGPRPPDTGRVDMVKRALERVYGVPWDGQSLRRGYVTAAIRTARWPRILRLLGSARRFGPTFEDASLASRLLGPVLDAASAVAPSDSAAAGFLRPRTPPGWLVDEVRHLGETFPERFRETVTHRMEDVENRNLETGKLETEPQRHPDSESTRNRLEHLRRRPPLSGFPA